MEATETSPNNAIETPSRDDLPFCQMPRAQHREERFGDRWIALIPTHPSTSTAPCHVVDLDPTASSRPLTREEMREKTRKLTSGKPTRAPASGGES